MKEAFEKYGEQRLKQLYYANSFVTEFDKRLTPETIDKTEETKLGTLSQLTKEKQEATPGVNIWQAINQEWSGWTDVFDPATNTVKRRPYEKDWVSHKAELPFHTIEMKNGYNPVSTMNKKFVDFMLSDEEKMKKPLNEQIASIGAGNPVLPENITPLLYIGGHLIKTTNLDLTPKESGIVSAGDLSFRATRPINPEKTSFSKDQRDKDGNQVEVGETYIGTKLRIIDDDYEKIQIPVEQDDKTVKIMTLEEIHNDPKALAKINANKETTFFFYDDYVEIDAFMPQMNRGMLSGDYDKARYPVMAGKNIK
jgi:hypothetical protein